MNTFLNYLVVAALFALVLAPAVLGFARERRIDRQLRDAERREVASRGAESALPVRLRPGPAVPAFDLTFAPDADADGAQGTLRGPGGPAQCPLLS
ncbi:hypothetical protein [Streptomyces badius]|nr:hypothetical protein [Streptomyces badius]